METAFGFRAPALLRHAGAKKFRVRAVRAGFGGDERDRTVDLRLAKPALSQLSYIPLFGPLGLTPGSNMVGPSRIELPTSRLSGVRSNQLSYGPTPLRSGRPDAL